MIDEESRGPTTPDIGPQSAITNLAGGNRALKNLDRLLDKLEILGNSPTTPTLDDVFDQQT